MRSLKFALLAVLFTALIPYASIYFLPLDTIEPLFQEDGIVEWIGAICWFLAALAFLLACIASYRESQGGHPFWYACLIIVTFVAGAEEISWGQRIFGFETPEVVARANLQGEMNFHNLLILDIKADEHGETQKQGWRRLLTFHKLGALIWWGYLVLLPLAYTYIRPIRVLCDNLRVPVVPVSIAVIAGLGYAAFALTNHVDRQRDINPMQINGELNEYKETLISIAFFLAALFRFKSERTQAST